MRLQAEAMLAVTGAELRSTLTAEAYCSDSVQLLQSTRLVMKITAHSQITLALQV